MNSGQLILTAELKEESQLDALVEQIKALLSSNGVLVLQGEMAAGKTTFTRHLCESFGLESTQSPTYSVHQRYRNNLICIDHLDLFRLENEEEIETAGLWDLLSEKDNLVILEWAERISGDWYPPDRKVYKLDIQVIGDRRMYQLFELSGFLR